MFRPFLLMMLTLIIGLSACQSKTEKQEALTEEEVEVVEERPSPPVRNSIDIGTTNLIIDYSSPGVKGRKIWGALESYDKIWRTGANEATWFSTSEDILINNMPLKAGKYGFFTIPGQESWTIILNKTWDQWGAYEYQSSDDVIRFEVPTIVLENHAERMVLDFEKDADNNAKLVFGWSDLGFSIPIEVK